MPRAQVELQESRRREAAAVAVAAHSKAGRQPPGGATADKAALHPAGGSSGIGGEELAAQAPFDDLKPLHDLLASGKDMKHMLLAGQGQPAGGTGAHGKSNAADGAPAARAVGAAQFELMAEPCACICHAQVSSSWSQSQRTSRLAPRASSFRGCRAFLAAQS